MPTMQSFTRHDLASLFRSFAARMFDERASLGVLDGEIGDADHGVAMAGGFEAAAKSLVETDDGSQTLGEGFSLAANTLLNAVGATTGPLYASALLRASTLFGDTKEVPFQRLPEIIIAMCEGIETRGHAKPGDKTMIDAWSPASHSVRLGLEQGADTVCILEQAAQKAAEGATSTRAMMAARGRAARLGPRSIGHLDPGAVSAAALIDAMATWAAFATSKDVS
ncbi:dihydroxyacetone kinase subunit DhaL [Thalassospira marina]|uniref:Dihydroxyacetone kinase subunit L n=1 Tax=Thalassospira marina TaxID=2048283 RepID=A0A2N3KT27_9PROT|nr:dihydroxyacetone kinase subunit L [Thalassospira marina]